MELGADTNDMEGDQVNCTFAGASLFILASR